MHDGSPPRDGRAPSVLVIEDDLGNALAVQAVLERNGFAVDVIDTGFEGEEAAARASYDAVLLDLRLPDRDGVDIAGNLRRRRVSSVIIMVSGRASVRDIVTGLDYGADDYLTKPYDPRELLARLRAKLGLSARLARPRQ